jgi:putative component of toxin-antitoxin plasmid stabilization module
MKRGIDIVIRSIHLEPKQEVVTLEIDKKDPATKFFKQLKKQDRNAYDSLETRIKTVSDYERYENKETFRHVGDGDGDGVYEFKRNNPKLIRLYAFYDEVEGFEKLILCTNGGGKKQQDQDILKAKAIKKKYLEAKLETSTRFFYEEPKRENHTHKSKKLHSRGLCENSLRRARNRIP